MPRSCSTCSRPDRLDVDEALATFAPLRALAARFGTSAAALHRHRRHTAPGRLATTSTPPEPAPALAARPGASSSAHGPTTSRTRAEPTPEVAAELRVALDDLRRGTERADLRRIGAACLAAFAALTGGER